MARSEQEMSEAMARGRERARKEREARKAAADSAFGLLTRKPTDEGGPLEGMHLLGGPNVIGGRS